MTFDFVSVLHTHIHTHLLLMLRYFCVYSLFILVENVPFYEFNNVICLHLLLVDIKFIFFITYAFLLVFSVYMSLTVTICHV